LTQAADGATKLADGASGLSTGLSKLSSGTAQSASGASSLATGTSTYVAGVSKIAGGLNSLAPGVTQYTGGVSQISAALTAAANTLKTDPTNATALGVVETLAGNLAVIAKGGPTINSGVKTLASGASQLAAGGPSLASGSRGLASGLSQLASGTSQSASGASSLASGASSLASGLKTGASQVPSPTTSQVKKTADVVSNPVSVSVNREHEVSSPSQIIATLFVPLGLWIGSLAVFLVMRPLTRRTLSSTAGNARIVLSSIARAGIVTAAQALLLVVLLHTAVGVSWALLPATILFSLVMAIAFTAFHYLLTIGLGRAGLVVSIFLLAIQITSTGGLYPIQLLAAPFQFISPLLPLTYGVRGMEAIISNSGAGTAIGAATALVAFGIGSLLVALLAVRRVRRARALGLVAARA
jgi:putative membrane protein